MSRYLRRVLSRSEPARGLMRAARPHRWAAQGDPFGETAEPVRIEAPRTSTAPAAVPAVRPPDSMAPSPREVVKREAQIAMPAPVAAREVTRVLEPPVGSRLTRRVVEPIALPAMSETRTVTTMHERTSMTILRQVESPVGPARDAIPARVEHPAMAPAPRSAQPQQLAMPLPTPVHRELPRPIEAPRVPTPLVTAPPVTAPLAAPIAPTVVALPAPAREAAAPIAPHVPEIVIGRISVIVDGGRPAAPVQRTIVRHVAAPRTSDDGGAAPLAGSGRFGLGQI